MLNLKIVEILSDGVESEWFEKAPEGVNIIGFKFQFTARTKEDLSTSALAPNTVYNITGHYSYGSNTLTSLHCDSASGLEIFYNWDLDELKIPFKYIDDCYAFEGLDFFNEVSKLFNFSEEEIEEINNARAYVVEAAYDRDLYEEEIEGGLYGVIYNV